MLAPPPTHLPVDPVIEDLLARNASAEEIARTAPRASLGWAMLGEAALERGDVMAAYAFGRTGYHRGLDALRGAGWKGFGQVPLDDGPNTAFLRAVAVLYRAVSAIEETDEVQRLELLLDDCDTRARSEFGLV